MNSAATRALSWGGKIFCRWGHKFVPFRKTRIAYLNQQVDADLRKKKVIAPNWPSFFRVFCRSPLPLKRRSSIVGLTFRVFCRSPTNKKKRSSSQHFQNATGEKFRTIMESLVGRRPPPPPLRL